MHPVAVPMGIPDECLGRTPRLVVGVDGLGLSGFQLGRRRFLWRLIHV